MNEVRREKAQLEKLIEQEHLSNSDLKSKLSNMRENGSAEDPLSAETEARPVAMDSVAESPDEEGDEDLEKEDHMEEEP